MTVELATFVPLGQVRQCMRGFEGEIPGHSPHESASLGNTMRLVVDYPQKRRTRRRFPPFAGNGGSCKLARHPPASMNPAPPVSDFAPYAFTLIPLVVFLVYTFIVLGLLAFGVVMVLRFVKSHERIARSLETLAARASEKTPAP
jgi:hypothetical protein